jgi:hypothetical protein
MSKNRPQLFTRNASEDTKQADADVSRLFRSGPYWYWNRFVNPPTAFMDRMGSDMGYEWHVALAVQDDLSEVTVKEGCCTVGNQDPGRTNRGEME